MEIVNIKLTDLKPYENNPRKNDQAVDAVAESIKQCGYIAPIIVDEDNVILAGHTRYKALKKLGRKEAECIVKAGLTEEQKRKYRLLDNKTNEFAEWDFDLLSDELEGLDFDGFDFGFDLGEGEESTEVTEDEYDAEPPAEPKAKPGDIYQLGRHRLMCGDSTDRECMEKLMDGQKADMVFTDPPYALFGNSTGTVGVSDDKMIAPFFRTIMSMLAKFTKWMGHIYVCCDWHSCTAINNNCGELIPKNCIIWQKAENGGIGAYYSMIYEMVWLFANEPKKSIMGKNKIPARTINGVANIWKIPIVQSKDREHNAQKPIELMKTAIENSSEQDENVLDLFGGSGSTLIACEHLDRICYMMELDPRYVDVIIDRWEKFTGQTAKLISEPR